MAPILILLGRLALVNITIEYGRIFYYRHFLHVEIDIIRFITYFKKRLNLLAAAMIMKEEMLFRHIFFKKSINYSIRLEIKLLNQFTYFSFFFVWYSNCISIPWMNASTCVETNYVILRFLTLVGTTQCSLRNQSSIRPVYNYLTIIS